MDFTSAVEWIKELLNTEVLTYGTTTLTIGYIIFLIIKWIVPNNKIINNQESTITILDDENKKLKETNAQLIKDVEILKKQMDVVLSNTQNRKYKEAKNIELLVNVYEELKPNVTELIKKAKKIKIKKGTTTNGKE